MTSEIIAAGASGFFGGVGLWLAAEIVAFARLLIWAAL